MASVDYMKVKTRAHLYNLIDHDAMETRPLKRHRNKHIDVTKTATENDQTWDAETARERFRARIDELDGTTNTNKRKDRVEAFSLEIKPPPGIPLDRQEMWLEDVYELIEGRVKKENVIGGYVHGDELHEYRDARTGLMRMSRKELHMLVVPEIAGKLNGRKFSSPASMKAMNKAIDKMTQARYGVPFLTGEDPADPSIPYGTSTAGLKMESELVQAVLDEHNGLMAQEREAANEYARTTRAKADKDAKETTDQAEQYAENMRQAADEYAENTVRAVQLQVDAMRKERDEARADRDKAIKDRKATVAALQGDYRTWAGLTSRPSAKALLGVLGAAIEASRTPEPPKSEIGAAYARMLAMMARQSQDAGRDGLELG